jgi:hypothetical protein
MDIEKNIKNFTDTSRILEFFSSNFPKGEAETNPDHQWLGFLLPFSISNFSNQFIEK